MCARVGLDGFPQLFEDQKTQGQLKIILTGYFHIHLTLNLKDVVLDIQKPFNSNLEISRRSISLWSKKCIKHNKCLQNFSLYFCVKCFME